MDGKVCIVTGATSGVGLEAARALAERGATVVLLARNPERGRAAVDSIAATATHPDRVSLVIADLAVLADVRRAAGEICARFQQVDVLINNAGVINMRRRETVDGFEETFAVNHLAHFLLTGLLLDRLRAAPQARIINVSSNAHVPFQLEFDDLQATRRYSTFPVYGRSKLANLYFTFELARRLGAGSTLTVNALHPGAVASGFAKNNGFVAKLAMAVAKPFFISPAKGAETALFLATSPDVREATGRYFYKSREIRPAAQALDVEVARKLWDTSDELTGFPYAQSLLPARFAQPSEQP